MSSQSQAPTRLFAESARAYGGQAHGRLWPVDADLQPVVWLEGDERLFVPYRIVLHPTTGCPARDPLGNVVYIPAAEAAVHAG